MKASVVSAVILLLLASDETMGREYGTANEMNARMSCNA
jgi:hypothetical protein